MDPMRSGVIDSGNSSMIQKTLAQSIVEGKGFLSGNKQYMDVIKRIEDGNFTESYLRNIDGAYDTYKEAVLANTKHRSDIIAAFKKTTGIDPTETQIQDAIHA